MINQKKYFQERKELYINEKELQVNKAQNQTNFPNFNFGALNMDIIDVTFCNASGYKVLISASKYMTLEDLFINYATKVGKPHDYIGSKIVFICHGRKIDPKSKQPISSIFKQNIGAFTVVDL